MSKWLKITIGITASLIIVLIAGGIIFNSMLKKSLPEYTGSITAKNIKNEIKIYRDSMAVPYIFTDDDEDVAFALGYVHAQDRLFTMDLIRRAGEGRLSEILGPKVLPFDEMFRTVGIERTAEKLWKNISPVSKKLLQAYSDGVNLYIKNAKGHYPIEFDVLGYDPEKWTPVSSLVIIRMMAWELNISWWSDIMYTRLVQKLGEQKVKELLPNYPENAPYIIPPEIRKYPKISEAFIKTDKAFRKFMGWTGTHIGSNNWIVNGKKSVSGKPIIANDTHLAFSAPSRWYAAVIKSKNWDAAGITLPGAPVIVVGKNKSISWAVTNIMEDDADFYMEKLDSTGTKYLYDGQWKNLNIIKDTIKVRDSSDVVIKILSTGHGPIISGIHPDGFLFSDKNSLPPEISMHWLGNEISDELFTFYKINKAQNWSEFKGAFKTYSVPGQNFVYGDQEGNIGYVFGAHLPIRESNSPNFIYDGTTSKYDWKGFVPENQLPTLFNPSDNFIASANNKTAKDFKYFITNTWEPGSRIERIRQLLTSKQKHSVKDFEHYQMDFVSPYAQKVTGYILNAFKDVKVIDKNLNLALELLRKWNYNMNPYSQTPAIYAMFYVQLLRNVYMTKMGKDLFNEFVFVENVPFRSVLDLLQNPNSSWFDDPATPQVENRDNIIRKSMDDALTALEKSLGNNLADWQWGRLHKVLFKNAFHGFSSIIDKYVDIGPYSIGGDGTTIFNTEYPFTVDLDKYPQFSHKPFENNLGPVMRYIYDFAQPNKIYLILTTGESGNIMSKHYSDMTQSWLNGKYMIIKTDSTSIERNKNLLNIDKN